MSNKDKLLEEYEDEEFLLADGFDESIVGVDVREMRVIYDVDSMIQTLVDRDGIDYEEALEFLEYNTFFAYVGEKTPIFLKKL